MRNLPLRLMLVVCLAYSESAQAQPSITQPRSFVMSGNALAVPDTLRANESLNRFFSRGGIGLGLGGDPRVNLESSAYQLAVYGRPKETKDASGNKVYIEHVAFQLFLDTYVVDALGDPLRSIKEYLFSKKGSPIALRLPALPWTTKRGNVRQFWAAGEFNIGARLIPLDLRSSSTDDSKLKASGSGTISYTQQVNIDFDLNKTPGNLFIEFTPSYNAILGEDLKAELAPLNGESRTLEPGIDYRIGYKFGSSNPRAISITGTRSFRELRGARDLLSFVFSADVQ